MSMSNHVRSSSAATDTASQAKSAADAAQAKVVLLERQVVNLLAITETLWTLVKKSHKLDDDFLIDRVKEIQKEDGTFNGRLQKFSAPICESCEKTIQKNQTNCMYCGSEAELQLFTFRA